MGIIRRRKNTYDATHELMRTNPQPADLPSPRFEVGEGVTVLARELVKLNNMAGIVEDFFWDKQVSTWIYIVHIPSFKRSFKLFGRQLRSNSRQWHQHKVKNPRSR